MDEIIALLIELRTDLILLKTTITSKDIKEQLKWAINGIDISFIQTRFQDEFLNRVIGM